MSGPVLSRRVVHHRRIPASWTPVSAFEALYADAPFGFLYESLESDGKRGRYSFLGGKPYAVFKSSGQDIEVRVRCGRTDGAEPGAAHPEWIRHRMEGHPLDVLRRLVNEARMDASVRPFSGGAVGFVSYDAIRRFERIPDANPDPMAVPEFLFMFPEEVLVFDHVEKTVDIVIHSDEPSENRLLELTRLCGSPGDRPVMENASHDGRVPESCVHPFPFQSDEASGSDVFRPHMTRTEFEAAVRRAKEYILAGDAFQVVLSQRFTFPVRTDPVRMYEALRLANPSPYMYYLAFGELRILGSSPEILVKTEAGRVSIRPLAGTRRRGRTEAEDLRLEAELKADEKERAEHVMLVDLARNDIGRVCRFGTVRASELFTVERYSRVMHLVSHVEGRLRPDKDAFDCFSACFPAGTVSGAPKVRAMEIIDELEPERRGVYGGSIGYFDFGGNMDMCIAIRTLVLRGMEGSLQAGAGIVADSDPEREYQETLNKARALFHAVAAAGTSVPAPADTAAGTAGR
ncbi:MAG: anthranilate synthase component I [bacterium]|nr:anthranilate synthase component I [bacterium]